jgi:hypothetical protein
MCVSSFIKKMFSFFFGFHIIHPRFAVLYGWQYADNGNMAEKCLSHSEDLFLTMFHFVTLWYHFFKGPSWQWSYGSFLQLPMQSVPITTDAVSLNLDQGKVYNIMW